jgi:GNAT superfamily N-acetyltransferase
MSFADQPGDTPVLERASQPSSRLFAASLAILVQSIPAEEQLPSHHLTELLTEDDYRLYAYHSSGDVYGFALVYLPAGKDFAWLDYMAVRNDRRGRGVGSKLFQEVVHVASAERPNAKWLLLEVDDDREGPEELRQTNRLRIQFYRRLGAHLLSNVPYRFPSPTGRRVPMRLMAYSLRPGADLSPQYVLRVVEGIFAGIHGRGGSDPLLGWIASQAPSNLILE